jgi:hypothetical protein
MEASLWTVICLQRFIHMTAYTNMPAKNYIRTPHCVYISISKWLHTCLRAQITPVNRVYNTYSNIHKHALRCGLNCIFKLVTQKITYLHYIKCSARRLQAAPCLPMSDLSVNILYTLSVRGTLRHVDVCIGSPQYDVLGAHKTNPNRRQFLFRGAWQRRQAPEFGALGGAGELCTYIYTHISKWERERLRAHVQGCARKRETRGGER